MKWITGRPGSYRNSAVIVLVWIGQHGQELKYHGMNIWEKELIRSGRLLDQLCNELMELLLTMQRDQQVAKDRH